MDEKEFMSKMFWLPFEKQQAVMDFLNFLYEKEVKGKEKQLDKRVPGLLKGKIKMLPGFDDPIEGMEEYYQ